MKIAILSSHFRDLKEDTEIGYETREIEQVARARGSVTYLLDPNKLSYGITNNFAFAKFQIGGGTLIDISDVDILLIRRTRGSVEKIQDFAEFAERANPNLVVVDALESLGRPTSKVESILRRVAKFPQPDTQIIGSNDSIENVRNFPVIAKPSHGAAGRGVKRCNDAAELELYMATRSTDSVYAGYGTLVQQALSIEHEFRVMVVNGVGLGCVSKSEIPGNPDARNSAQGGVFSDYQGINRTEIIKFAEQVSQYLKQDISGVDIIQSEGKLYLIECNRNPQFQAFDYASQTRTAEKIYDMFANKLEQQTDLSSANPESIDVVTNTYPRVFVGSSSEGLDIAEEIQVGLKNFADTVLWNQGVFPPTHNALTSLGNALQKFDWAIFCITPDDLTRIRSRSVFEPRDNVIFEAGLFMGGLGLNKVILVVCEDEWPSLPSDFDGTTYVTWRRQASGSLRASIGPAIRELKVFLGLV